MDDDDFGGFEAAESFEFGNGEKQTTSPAIAWAAFPTGMDKTTIKNLNIPLLELEYLLEKHNVLEADFLKEKKEKVLSHQDHYKTLQEKHKQELEDMRKAGHEALTIIVEEFKALLQSTVQQQEAAIEKQYILAIEKHSHKCEELLDAQHQRLLDILEAEKEVLSEKIEEALMQQSQKQKKVLDKCLDEERQRSKEALAAAAKAEKEVMQEAILKAVEEERRNMEKIHAEERKLWEAERDSHKEKITQAVSEAMREQRKQNQVSMLYPSMHLLCVFFFLLNVFCCCIFHTCESSYICSL
uniref:Coiled-coil domain containing 91 n=1 Tax=Malurus cyaneus samueli TaxID=2593467 RepID=A0A8C5UDF8_9PASS